TSSDLNVSYRNIPVSAHTNYLVNLLKSCELSLNQGRVFYIEPPPCQPFIFKWLRYPKTLKNSRIKIRQSGAHFTLNHHLVNRYFEI
ncbi:hypothetical protein, partial [Mangrovitalea sediminis]|uniref:hypothetical protein n=1 Tax=Mangrovitalea sediminis TaxID=1982043 RepID=UPI001D0D3854